MFVPASACARVCPLVPACLGDRALTTTQTTLWFTGQCSSFNPGLIGEWATGSVPVKRWTTWTRGGQAIGKPSDVPATAPQWGRIAPPSPSGTRARITPPPAFAARRVCCAVTVRWSRRRMVTVPVLMMKAGMVIKVTRLQPHGLAAHTPAQQRQTQRSDGLAKRAWRALRWCGCQRPHPLQSKKGGSLDGREDRTPLAQTCEAFASPSKPPKKRQQTEKPQGLQ